jgi:cytochrome c biogenesis protein
VREQALAAFHHKAEGRLAPTARGGPGRVNQSAGARRLEGPRPGARPHGTMVAARKGMGQQDRLPGRALGDRADLPGRPARRRPGGADADGAARQEHYSGGGLVGDVPAEHRLSPANPTFRGNLLVPEGQRAGVAILNDADGVVLQDLPFDVELKKFIVEYYDTGMPKLFASEIVIHDHETGRQDRGHGEGQRAGLPPRHRPSTRAASTTAARRSSCAPCRWACRRPALRGRRHVGGTTELTQRSRQKLTLEFTGLRVINVENLGGERGLGHRRRARVDLASTLQATWARAPSRARRRNCATSARRSPTSCATPAGQAREFHNYMVPVELDGQRVFLAGVRDTPGEPFRYLRIPADDERQHRRLVRLRRR